MSGWRNIAFAAALVFAAAEGVAAAVPAGTQAEEVRLKDLGRFLGWRDNALIGYGIVTGLAGSGDSPRSIVTQQALSNVLSRLGSNVPGGLLQSRNVAAVMVTATLPPSANIGDRIDVTVTSIGDARSLVGGVLLMTPLLGPDKHDYALAQGALVVGGYNFEDNVNLRQKNYPTTGIVAGGATVEEQVAANLAAADGHLTFILRDPDFTTAQRIAVALNAKLGMGAATVESAEAVRISAAAGANPSLLVSLVETVTVAPDQVSRVVINERSGTVVAGGGVRVSSVVIAQGDIKVSVTTDDSYPVYGLPGRGRDGHGIVVTNSKLDVSESTNDTAVRFPNTTVADLVRGLTQARVGTRNIIAILQAIKAAGALHADIVVQ
ncbi:MAG: flagellar basal body P-ring protein FlgI [Rhizomicrobium sp.]